MTSWKTTAQASSRVITGEGTREPRKKKERKGRGGERREEEEEARKDSTVSLSLLFEEIEGVCSKGTM